VNGGSTCLSSPIGTAFQTYLNPVWNAMCN